MQLRAIKGNGLFWRIAAVFTLLLIVLGIVFFVVASKFSKSYYTTAHQQLYGDIAQHLATFTQPLKNGKPDTTVTHDIIHSTMVANPSVEVYLLDTAGNITDYVVPDKTVQIHRVNIDKVKQWLAIKNGPRPLGDNPKQPEEPGIFSAAPVYEQGRLTGYVYAVLASERQAEILRSLNSQLFFQLSSSIFFTALLAAFLIGVVTFFLMTKSFSKITGMVRRFKEGDFSARIEGNAKGDLGMLGATFNEMADVIVDNFDKLAATDKFRQELIANVSHDLRTPLSIMQGYVETLLMKQDGLSETEKTKYLAVVHDNTKKLSALVEQLFQYAKLEANLVVPEKEAFLVNELASDILMSYQLKAKARNIHLVLDSPNSLPLVFGDIALTERVFQNLLENAFKFTPDGGSIGIQLEENTAGVAVKITDTGIGIAPEKQAYIFERYKQLNKYDTSKNDTGMGIGLSIVKKILELHQASIEVTSQVGSGTTFRFLLPAVAN